MARKKSGFRQRWRDLTRPWRHMRCGQKVLFTILFCLFALLTALVVNVLQKDAAEQTRKVTYGRELNAIERRQLEIQKEMETTVGAIYSNMDYRGDVTFFVETLKAETAWDLYEEMQENGLSGVFLLSNHSFPEGGDNLSSEEFSEMMEEGWSWGFLWEGTPDFPAWLSNMMKRSSDLGLGSPEVVVIRANCAREEYEAVMKTYDIPRAVFTEETGALAWDAETGKTWQTELRGWNTAGTAALLEKSGKEGGTVFLTVGRTRSSERYRAEAFHRMLEQIYQWRNGGLLDVLNCDEHFRRQAGYADSLELLNLEKEKALASLQEEYRQNEIKKQELYRKYFPDGA